MSLARFKAPGAALLSAALLLGGAGAQVARAQAPSPPSARFYGSITVNGANAQSGAIVTAYAGTTLCGTAAGAGLYNGTVFFVDITGTGACATPGTTISFQVNGQATTQTAQIPQVSGAVQVNLTTSGGTATGGPITYQPGWNLVSGPAGTLFTQASNPLYTLTATSGGSYTTVPNTQGTASGQGYWAYFTTATTVSLSGTSQTSATVTAPAGQYIMIGNPSSTKSVTVSGADVVYTYTATGGYVATTTLAPGQGAWAYSAAGGTLTIQ